MNGGMHTANSGIIILACDAYNVFLQLSCFTCMLHGAVNLRTRVKGCCGYL